MKSPDLVAKLMIEFLGTMFLVMTIKLSNNKSLNNATTTFAPLAIGTVLMIWVFIGGHISGGMYNPSVSLGVYLRGIGSKSIKEEFPLKELISYVAIQFSGGIVGGLISAYIGGTGSDDIYPQVGSGYSLGVGFVSELMYNCLLVYVVLSVTNPGLKHNQFYGVCIGMTVMVSAYSIAEITGASLNPAVYVGTVISAAVTKHHGDIKIQDCWIYFLAPLLASFIASGCYRVIYKFHDADPKHAQLFEETQEDFN